MDITTLLVTLAAVLGVYLWGRPKERRIQAIEARRRELLRLEPEKPRRTAAALWGPEENG